MSKIIRGRAWVFGDNIDTDIIAPADTISFGLGDRAEEDIVKKNAFRAVRPDFYKNVEPGDILIAGRNFGLGSHREPANKVLVSLGFGAVVAESIARLFFRNSVAIGFYAYQAPGIRAQVSEGEQIEIDVDAGELRNLTRGTTMALARYSPLIRSIIDQGGILEVMKSRLAEKSA